MAEELEGEEFVVDKILDKRVRNGKIEYYLSWKVREDPESSHLIKKNNCIYYLRALVRKRIHGNPKKISIVLI